MYYQIHKHVGKYEINRHKINVIVKMVFLIIISSIHCFVHGFGPAFTGYYCELSYESLVVVSIYYFDYHMMNIPINNSKVDQTKKEKKKKREKKTEKKPDQMYRIFCIRVNLRNKTIAY
jgi:hypothetical protein